MREHNDEKRAFFGDGTRIQGDLVQIWLEMTFQTMSRGTMDAVLACAIPAEFDVRLLVMLLDISIEAGEAILNQLLAANLIVPVGDSSYAYYDVVRAHFLDVWRTPERRWQYTSLIHKLSEYYLPLTYEQTLRAQGPDFEAALAILDKFYPNLEAIWESAVAVQHCELIHNLVSMLEMYHTQRGLWKQKVAWLKTALHACRQTGSDADRARMLNSLGVAYLQLELDGSVNNAEKAIQCYEEALKFYNPKTTPMDYAMVQNNLGNVYLNGVSANRASDLVKAIAHYENAVQFCTLETDPRSYGIIQTNLGFAYAELPSGNRMQNLRHAIAAYKQGLRVHTKESAPFYFAKLQLGLGAAYANLTLEDAPHQDERERDTNLRLMIKHYQTALDFYTFQVAPAEYAQIQMDLAQAYTLTAAGGKAQNLHKAIDCYDKVLRFYTFEQTPQIYAEVHVASGLLCSQLPVADVFDNHNAQHLLQAIEHYRKALDVYTFEDAPLSYAQVMVYLGIVYAQLATGERASDLQYALVYYQEALRGFALGMVPLSYTEIYTQLGQTYTRLAMKDADANLLCAITCYQAALKVYTSEHAPLVNAHLQNRLGLLYAQLQSDDWEVNLRKAILCFKHALHFWGVHKEGESNSVVAQENLKSVYEALACLYASQGEIHQVDALFQEVNEQYVNDMQRSHFWTSIGATYFRQGRLSEATRAYQKATELNTAGFRVPESVDILLPT